MELTDIPVIDSKWFDCNYNVSVSDLEATEPFRQGLVSLNDEKVLKSILWLLGIDINKQYEPRMLVEGQAFRSPITDIIQREGLIYSGFERTDPAWKKDGLLISMRYLFDVNSSFVKMLKEKQ